MSDENWMGPEELRAIADYCDALAPLWDALTSGPKSGVSIDCESLEINVYDSNGDSLGRISWGDGGPALYPTTHPTPSDHSTTPDPTTATEQGASE